MNSNKGEVNCDRCGHWAVPIDAHGKIRCSICQQVLTMGDCCQGETHCRPDDPAEGVDVPN